MADASHRLTGSLAASLGRLVAAYSRAAVSPQLAEFIIEQKLTGVPSVWIGWHEGNMITLALHGHLTGRKALAFVPPGLSGHAMRGWLEGLGVTPVALADDARRGLGLRQMEAALQDGKDVLIAVDGPHGPPHRVAPGAMWLARAMGVEVRPVGAAASSRFELPRWDRLIVPVPGARTVVTIGAALPPAKGREGRTAAERIAATLNALTAQAQDAVLAEPRLRLREMLPWR